MFRSLNSLVWKLFGICHLLFGIYTVPASAGHSRHPYFDGGQSVHGRFVVTAELVTEPGQGKKPGESWCYQSQVYWQANFPELTRDNAPRVGYALYQISPDYTVLETLVGATDEAARKAKERGVTPPPPRLVRVDLITGKVLPAGALLPPDKTPERPFLGGLGRRGKGENGQANYVPSLDPVRVEGTFRIVENGSNAP